MTRLLAVVASLLCTSPVAFAQSTLQILDYGAEPRAPLRYKFEAGKSERVVMEMTMSLVSEVGGKVVPVATMPSTRTTMLIRVVEVAPDGSARLEFESQSAEAPVGQATGQVTQPQVDRTLTALSLLKGSYRSDSRGRILANDTAMPAGVFSANETQMMNSLMGSQNEALQQFPDEPLGVGARWVVMQKLDLMGVKIEQGQEYTLRSRNGNRVELDTKLIQPKFDTAGAPAMTGMPISSESTGTGTMVFDLNGLIPLITLNVNTTTTLPVASQSQSPPSKMMMQMKMTTGPATN